MGRADVIAAVTGDDEDNLVACQVAKMHFNVPRAIARVNNPKNEALFRQLAIDDTVSPTRTILGVIEHEIPIHDLLHLAELEGGGLEIVEAVLTAESPVVGRELRTCRCRKARRSRSSSAARAPCRPGLETRLVDGDRMLAITSAEREPELRRLLIGD